MSHERPKTPPPLPTMSHCNKQAYLPLSHGQGVMIKACLLLPRLLANDVTVYVVVIVGPCCLRGFPSQTATWTMTDHLCVLIRIHAYTHTHLLDIVRTHTHPCVLIRIHDRPSSVCPSPRYGEVWRQKAFFSPSPSVESSRMSEFD